MSSKCIGVRNPNWHCSICPLNPGCINKEYSDIYIYVEPKLEDEPKKEPKKEDEPKLDEDEYIKQYKKKSKK